PAALDGRCPSAAPPAHGSTPSMVPGAAWAAVGSSANLAATDTAILTSLTALTNPSDPFSRTFLELLTLWSLTLPSAPGPQQHADERMPPVMSTSRSSALVGECIFAGGVCAY